MPRFRWLRPRPRMGLLPFVNVEGERRVIVCATPDDYALCFLHFLGNGSVPCIGSKCHHCQSRGAELHAYAPALFQHPSNSEWVRGVLDLGNPNGEAASADLRNHITTLFRGKNADDSKTGLRIVSMVAIDPVFAARFRVEWFDVRHRLEQRWGMDAIHEQDEACAADAGKGDDSTASVEANPAVLPFTPRPAA